MTHTVHVCVHSRTSEGVVVGGGGVGNGLKYMIRVWKWKLLMLRENKNITCGRLYVQYNLPPCAF